MADIFSQIADRAKARLGILPADAAPDDEPFPVPPLHGGSPFGAQTTPGAFGERARRTEIARRGFAPATFEGISTALGNALGVVQAPIQTLAATALERAFDITGLGGIQDIPGHFTLDDDLREKFIAGDLSITEAVREQTRRRDEQAFREGGRIPSTGRVSGASRSTFGKTGRFGFGGTAEGRTGPPGDLSRDPTPGKAGR